MAAKWLGAHMPTKGGLGSALRAGHAIGCTAVQVFTSSPQQWKAKPVTAEMVEAFQVAQAETGIHQVVSHDSYLVNLCAPDPEKREQSFQGLKAEMDRCAAYGIFYVVSHLGAHMGQGEEVGLELVADSVSRLLEETDPRVHLLAETTAGQGSSLDYCFDHLQVLLERTGAPERLGVCVDTCHIFAAGYDIRTREGYEKVWLDFEAKVGIHRVKAIHCNDSKKPLGSRVDRHEHIGEGEIGSEAFHLLVNDPRFEEVPILLETPDAETMHAVNLAKLRTMAGLN